MPRGKGKRRASQQEYQRDKIRIRNVKKRKREENRQCDKQAKRRKIEWFRDIRSILRSSGQKIDFPKDFNERKLNKIQKGKKCLRYDSFIDCDQPGPSKRSTDNFHRTMAELDNRCCYELDDFIDSISSGSSLVEVNDAPVIIDDYELHTSGSHTQINQIQENVPTHNLFDQVQENTLSHNLVDQEQENTLSHYLVDQEQGNIQIHNLMGHVKEDSLCHSLLDQHQADCESHNLNDQARRNSHFDNLCSTSDSILNPNGCQQSTNFSTLINMRHMTSKDTGNSTIIEPEDNININTTNCDIESFILPSTELIDKSNFNKYLSSVVEQNERSEVQGHSNLESGDHSHNLAEISLNNSRNYCNFNSNRDYDDRMFYFGSAVHEQNKESNIANFSFASHSNNSNDNQDLQPDEESRNRINDYMEVEENNIEHLQEGGNYYSNELNRNTNQLNDLSKCLLYPTDTFVYNNNNQLSSGDENVSRIENFHHQNSLAYYDNSTGAFLKSSSLQNNSSTSQSLKKTWGSIKNLLSRVSGQKSSDNQHMKEGNNSEESP